MKKEEIAPSFRWQFPSFIPLYKGNNVHLLSCCNIRLFLVQNSFSSLILILSMIFRNSQQ